MINQNISKPMQPTKMSTFYFFLILLIALACTPKPETASLILINGTVYTASETLPKAEAVAVTDGVIVAVGSTDEIMQWKSDHTEVLDLSGKFIYPGFAEGHAHIMGIGANLQNVDLMDARSYSQVVDRIKERAAQTPKGEWIIGRGWHQDKWEENPERMFSGFPTHHQLSEAVPDHPVWMKHASGHAGLANARAMTLAEIDKSTQNPEGGEIFKDVSGQPTGVFNETAASLIGRVIPEETKALRESRLDLAIEECLSNGITSFHQAGSGAADVDLIESFARDQRLKLRMHVMLDGKDSALLESYFEQSPRILAYDEHLNIRSIKLYADGALGSCGAWLLEQYSDAEDVYGHNVTPLEEIEAITSRALENGFQICTHAIGDRANREILDIYQRAFEANPAISGDHRFRIEHAQHIHPNDIPRFAELGVFPAMQAIHMSSDRPWAIDRLGEERIANGAYMWSDLIDNGSKIINGSDAPVEPVNPLASFYASVSRKTLKGKPEGGYEPGQKMTREEALKSYTLWPAFGAFMDDRLGSIDEEKLADFTILDQDIMTIPEEEILKTEVKMTIIGGKVVYAD